MNTNSTFKQVLILTPFVFCFAFGLDIYIPVVPQMAQIFATTPALIQLTLSLFLFITGAGQLIIGPLSDRFGRKPLLFASAACFFLGSAGCGLSAQIEILLVCRAISACGACGMLVTSFAVVRDLYSDVKSGQMFSYLNGGIGISPVFAPIIGGYLATNFGWPSIFYFLAGLGAFALFMTMSAIDETLPTVKRVSLDSTLLRRYKEIFNHPQFIIYSVLAGLAEAVFFCFFSISPFILINLHQIPTEHFGYYFALFGAVVSLGGISSGKLIGKIGVRKTLAIGIALMFIGGGSMLLWHHFNPSSLTGFLLPMVLACLGAMFLLGGSASKALEPFGAIAGTAAAGFGAVEFAIPSLVGSVLMLFPVTSTFPYAVTILLLAGLSLQLFRIDKPQEAASDPLKA